MSTPPAPAPAPPLPLWRRLAGNGMAVGIAYGALYGLAVRLMIAGGLLRGFFLPMSFAFLFVVPLVVGFLAVRPRERPSWPYALLQPWLPVSAATLLSALIGWEGAICIVMGLPILLVNASLGGIVALVFARRRQARGSTTTLAMVLPFAVGMVEGQLPEPWDVHTVRSTIAISAPPAVVWREIVSVREIERREIRGNPLFLRLGFPRPLSAEIDREEVGGVRRARFAGGVLFLETVTDLELERLLSFRIAAQTDAIPRGTLDEHVTIGGPYFDVLQGTYRIVPGEDGLVTLELESRMRVSTHFNWYATLWADRVMRSIQENILEVQKRRAEGGEARYAPNDVGAVAGRAQGS